MNQLPLHVDNDTDMVHPVPPNNGKDSLEEPTKSMWLSADHHRSQCDVIVHVGMFVYCVCVCVYVCVCVC